MNGYKKVLIIFASTIVIGVLLIISRVPLILATYSGTHSVETSTGNLDCLLCHKYIENEFNHSPQTWIVFEKHKAAAGNVNYTTFIKYGYKYNSSEGRIYTSGNNLTWDKGASADPTTYLQWYTAMGWIDNRTGEFKNVTLSLDVDGIAGIQNEEMCLLCHKSDMYDIEAHGVTIIGCTDIKCHGNADSEGYADTFYATGKAGTVLAQDNVHSEWFRESRNTSEFFNYAAHNSTKVSDDFLACIGCHTDVGANINATGKIIYSHNNKSMPSQRYS